MFRQDDLAREDFGPRLIADAKLIAETLSCDQQSALTFAFEQGVGGDGGAHLYDVDEAGGNCGSLSQSEQFAYALDGGVFVARGAFGEQFARDQCAIGPLRHNVGKGAAAIDPELPGHFVEYRGLRRRKQLARGGLAFGVSLR